jgi:AcrR family transcriptional regulator
MNCMTETAVPGLRERKKQQTRDAIVDAALDLFERQGYDATTVEEIAEAADISPRTFFRYFDSKVEVIMDKRETDHDDFGERLAERPAHEGPVEAMRQVISAELGQVVQESPLFVRQMRLMLRTPSLHALAREQFHEHEGEIAVEVAKRLHLPADDLRVHVTAAALGNAIWAVVDRWVDDDEAAPERLLEMINEACTLLSTGLDHQKP